VVEACLANPSTTKRKKERKKRRKQEAPTHLCMFRKLQPSSDHSKRLLYWESGLISHYLHSCHSPIIPGILNFCFIYIHHIPSQTPNLPSSCALGVGGGAGGVLRLQELNFELSIIKGKIVMLLRWYYVGFVFKGLSVDE
jgi:hypothetical protein